ncbi:hypothetical protein ACFOSC_16410 [Streptantibioticus rubrisoli]|uniref:Uncharacterized protein n=1 Tax=Streptantibioticus rubrisoli TaxID=1387313 RepID=A0ABT1PDC6_9ACTN|nr:hypothetical protein [Streptantibioticus rubrisoli]MCQ4042453.1 hypothetical protein [Streptantibioticus rubrisoli]
MLTPNDEHQFHVLMDDLRSLTGCRALLETETDLATVQFLLSLVGQRGEDASERARLLLARIRASDAGD